MSIASFRVDFTGQGNFDSPNFSLEADQTIEVACTPCDGAGKYAVGASLWFDGWPENKHVDSGDFTGDMGGRIFLNTGPDYAGEFWLQFYEPNAPGRKVFDVTVN